MRSSSGASKFSGERETRILPGERTKRGGADLLPHAFNPASAARVSVESRLVDFPASPFKIRGFPLWADAGTRPPGPFSGQSRKVRHLADLGRWPGVWQV